MQIRNVLNGGVAEVGEEYAQELLDSGYWVSGDAPAPKRRAPRVAAKVAPADSEE